MTEYYVQWDIQIEASDPVAAAIEAWKIQHDWENLATVFSVTEMQDGHVMGRTVQSIDLEYDTAECKGCYAVIPYNKEYCQDCTEKRNGNV